MARTLYPTGADLQSILAQAGISITDPTFLDGAVRAGIQAFETACSRHFLAGKSIENADEPEATRLFDPPMAYEHSLWLGPWGDVTAISSVVHQAKPDGQPTTLVENRDYFPEPANNPARGLGYNRLRRGRWASWTWHGWDMAPCGGGGWMSGVQSIEITGLWGYGTTIPEDAWLAMAYGGVLFAEGQLGLIRNGGRTAYSVTGAVSEQFDVKAFISVIESFGNNIKGTSAYYRVTEL